nr:immunoglobulin heavy chain junction region [Macaca mulatta]MOV50761.1 immunoglobulin heavy chain junction region [Macaca mulatta]MOV52016.1 immunoglobulin heavy chain junction region [Macaca mulatta]MOV52626.1 immunoglobulin heavy chain junction region [Macaca mulatta]
CCSGVPLMW